MKKMIVCCLGMALLALSAFASVQSDIAGLEAELAAATDAAQVKLIKIELDELYRIEPPVIHEGSLDEAPANDLCADAISVAIGSTTPGTTVDATFDDAPFCDYSNTAPGVWYLVVGDGNIMTASTCDSADFDTKLGIFKDGCETLTCVAGNDDGSGCSGYTSEIEWTSTAGIEYLILVHGYSANVGNFKLTITSEPPPQPVLPNDLCVDAFELAVPSITQGTTVEATFDDVEHCDGYPSDHLGVWYSIVGTGNEITLSTCDEGSNFDTQIHLYEGVCGQLTCVAGNDDDYNCEFNGLLSTLTFCSEFGVVYHIMITGYSYYTGDFVLHVEDSGIYCGPCIAPDEVALNMDELPFCHCIYVCGDQPMTLCVGPLGPHEQPDGYSMTPGCEHDPRTPPGGCDDDACPPVQPTIEIPGWTYDAPNSRWCITIISDADGCFCFCLDSVLPVELNSFSAIAGDREITLNWTTASETDNDHFDIVRDGSVAGRVNAINSATGSNYSWTEANLINGREYSYTLYAVSLSGLREAVAVASATPSFTQATVTEYALHQNFPNPFNPETSISFDLLESETVALTVTNALGQTVATLVNGTMSAGNHTVSFEAADLPSGIYFYQLEAGDFSAVRKMVLMK